MVFTREDFVRSFVQSDGTFSLMECELVEAVTLSLLLQPNSLEESEAVRQVLRSHDVCFTGREQRDVITRRLVDWLRAVRASYIGPLPFQTTRHSPAREESGRDDAAAKGTGSDEQQQQQQQQQQDEQSNASSSSASVLGTATDTCLSGRRKIRFAPLSLRARSVSPLTESRPLGVSTPWPRLYGSPSEGGDFCHAFSPIDPPISPREDSSSTSSTTYDGYTPLDLPTSSSPRERGGSTMYYSYGSNDLHLPMASFFPQREGSTSPTIIYNDYGPIDLPTSSSPPQEERERSPRLPSPPIFAPTTPYDDFRDLPGSPRAFSVSSPSPSRGPELLSLRDESSRSTTITGYYEPTPHSSVLLGPTRNSPIFEPTAPPWYVPREHGQFRRRASDGDVEQPAAADPDPDPPMSFSSRERQG